MESQEKHVSKITFNNEPKLSEHEADKVFNETRVRLVSHVRSFLSLHDRFKGKEVSVTFAQKGISSLISIIEAPDEKLILKIPLSTNYAEGEVSFLKAWEQAGVKVPHVFEEGVLDGHSYALMQFVDAPILTEAYSQEELAEKEIYREMGNTLRLMHTPEAKGYGRIVDNKAEFAEFEEWLFSPDMETRINYVKEHDLLGEEHGSISTTRETLQAHVKENPKSSYCHDDFGAANIFATHPITVFDPNPRFNNGYTDLGRSMVIHLSQGVSPQQLVEGYFGNDPYNEKALHAAVLLNTYMKFPYWHKVKKTMQIENMQKYLIAHGTL
jgi:fructosamine-3-kinase